MEHGFPPSDLLRVHPATLQWIMRCVLLLQSGILIALRFRPAKSGEIWFWASLIFAGPIMVPFILFIIRPEDRFQAEGILVRHMLLTWCVSFAGLIASHWALKRTSKKSDLGFSLVLCACYIFLYATVKLPSLGTPIEFSWRSQCKNNLKEIMLGVHYFHDIYSGLPQSKSGEPLVSWRVRLLPLLEQQELFDSYDQTQRWDSPANTELAREPVPQLMCPSRRLPDNRADSIGRKLTDYVMLTGPSTVSPPGKRQTLYDVTDGTSNTLSIVEATGHNIVWTEPRDVGIDRAPHGINLKGAGKYDSPGVMSSWHVRGAHAAFADGSVRFISQSIDPSVLRALMTANGGESINRDAY